MSQTCSICRSKQRCEIDSALAAGTSYRNIAERYGASLAALNRHRKHAAQVIVKAAERRDESIGESILARLERLYSKTERILADAEASGDGRLALQAVRETRDTLGAVYRLATDAASGSNRSVIHVELIPIGRQPTVCPNCGSRVPPVEADLVKHFLEPA